jgi:hypothetical protein
MKLKALSVLAGVGGTLIMCDHAAGGYLDLAVTHQPNAFGLNVGTVYAEFDNPNDRVLAVAGTAAAPLSLDATDGGFLYQHPVFDGETAPNPALFGLFPSLAYDTFVTFGVLVNDGTDATQLTPGWINVGDELRGATNQAWFVTPDSAQGAPSNYRVLIGQFSSDYLAARGRFVILALSDGEPILIHTGFCSYLSTPTCTEGDVNGDNIVGIGDFLAMLGAWGTCRSEGFCWEDLNEDGEVNVVDFLILLANWTPPPEPIDFIDADLNGDGVVDNVDLLTLLGTCWGPVGAGCEAADYDGDGVVGVRDLFVLLADWG